MLEQEPLNLLLGRFFILDDELLHIDGDKDEQTTNTILLNVPICVICSIFQPKILIVSLEVIPAH